MVRLIELSDEEFEALKYALDDVADVYLELKVSDFDTKKHYDEFMDTITPTVLRLRAELDERVKV